MSPNMEKIARCLDLAGRADIVNRVWQNREKLGVDYDKSVMQENDLWDPMLNAEYAMAPGWCRLGSA